VNGINQTNFVLRSNHTNVHPVWIINLGNVTLHNLKELIIGKFKFPFYRKATEPVSIYLHTSKHECKVKVLTIPCHAGIVGQLGYSSTHS